MPKATSTVPLTGALKTTGPFAKLKPSSDNINSRVNDEGEEGFKAVLTKASRKVAKKAQKKHEALAKLVLDAPETKSELSNIFIEQRSNCEHRDQRDRGRTGAAR
jgi:hypothetical protein